MARCTDCKDCIHVRIACAIDNRIVNGKGCWSYFTTAKKEESKMPKELTFGDLYNAWKAGERGKGVYQNIQREKINFENYGIFWDEARTELQLCDGVLTDTYTKCEKITETDLIGALKMQENGTADRFRLRSKSGAVTQWETNPLLLASGVVWTTLTFECKKEG